MFLIGGLDNLRPVGPPGRIRTACGMLVLFTCCLAFGQDANGAYAGGHPSNSNAETESPNIVMIISDDQAWTDFGFMGHEIIETPHLDMLAKQSLVFRRGYVPTSLCRPSLATLITGLYASQHGITGNDPSPAGKPRGFFKSDDYINTNQQYISRMANLETLPRLLAKRGYSSFQCGKWWEGHYSTAGFTAGMTIGDPNKGGRHGDAGLKIGRKSMKPVFDFIDANTDRPFFVWYAPFLPHTPHNPPPELLEKYQNENVPPATAKYRAMCEWFDQTCGDLLRHLDKRGVSDNTIVIFVTDNGWLQRTKDDKVPNGWRSAFLPGSKQSPYEGGIRTPIMVRWPAKVKPRFDDDHLASSVDLAKTILTACGIEPSKNMMGIDLLDTDAVAKREMIWGEVFAHDMPDIKRPQAGLLYRWAIQGNKKVVQHHAGESNRYKKHHSRDSMAAEYYDLKQDPAESTNLAKEKQDETTKLSKILDEQASQAILVPIQSKSK